MPPYPRWRYFPSYAAPPGWVGPLTALFAANRAYIDSAVIHAKRMESNDVLDVIAAGLQKLGFAVEQGKKKAGKLPRPVFFGDEGNYLRTYETTLLRLPKALRSRSRLAGLPWVTRSIAISFKQPRSWWTLGPYAGGTDRVPLQVRSALREDILCCRSRLREPPPQPAFEGLLLTCR